MRNRGTSYLELLCAIVVVSLAMMLMLQQIIISHREGDLIQDRAFAYQKAMAMLTEVQAAIQRGDVRDLETLEMFDDQGESNPVLTTLTEDGMPLQPDHPTSENRRVDGRWSWARLISVQQLPEQERLRYLRIRVSKHDRGGTLREVAGVGGLINVPSKGSASVKTYDVFVLALAAAPSTWAPISDLRPALESAAAEISALNPALRFRLHWITSLGYGRDPLYTPYVNTVVPADQRAPRAYWYPSLLGDGHGHRLLFLADFFSGRIRTDSGVLNGYHATLRPHPHSVADQFNHCLRSPEARRLYEDRLAAGLESEDSPPLQILLQDMYEDPDRYRHAVFLNLHGSALPFPPLRNYSDAAEVPDRLPNVRVVTHPARLWTERDPDGKRTQDMEFRVYAYKTDPDSGPAVLDEPITVQIMGVDLAGNVNARNGGGQPTTLEIRRATGGVDPVTGMRDGTRSYCEFDDVDGVPPRLGEGPAPFEMSHEVGFVAAPEPYTWIRLYNTPLVTPPVEGQGLHPDARLYGMEYVPSPVVDDRFAVELASTSGGVEAPKNTARWRIRIPSAAFDSDFPGWPAILGDARVDVITRIGFDVASGQVWPTLHEPYNRSVTHSWWTASPLAVPVTERYQFQGDPRHNPYADLTANGESFPNGYNWFFDDMEEHGVNASGDWPCLDDELLREGYAAGVAVDAPRMLSLWREVLQACNAQLVQPDGELARYLVVGGELALPPVSPGDEPSAVDLHGALHGQVSRVAINNLSPGRPGGRSIVVESDTGNVTFWARDWLGELAPDSAYPAWAADGNLPAGVGAGFLHRKFRSAANLPDLPFGTSLSFPSSSQLGVLGPAALLAVGDAKTAYAHTARPAGQEAGVTSRAAAFLSACGIVSGESVSCRLPFELSRNLNSLKDEIPHVAHPDCYPAQWEQTLEIWYTLWGDLIGGAALQVEDENGAKMLCSILSITPSGGLGREFVLRTSLLMGLRGIHLAGIADEVTPFLQLPQVEIVAPKPGKIFENPSYVGVRWATHYLRFDGEPFTEDYPSEWTGDESSLEYLVLYSPDEGLSWFHAVNHEPAAPDEWPEDPSPILSDAGLGDDALLVLTPESSMPGGDYLLRVVCRNRGSGVHVSRHEVRCKIVR